MKKDKDKYIIKKYTYKDEELFAVQEKAANSDKYYTITVKLNNEQKPLVFKKESDAKKIMNALWNISLF